jgi:sugar lactone lactonase YvrE
MAIVGVASVAAADIMPVAALTAASPPEGIATDARGNIYTTLTFSGEVLRIAPDGTQSTIGKFKNGMTPILGLEVGFDGSVYVAVGTQNAPGTDTHGVWRIDAAGTKSLVAAMPAPGLPNSLAWTPEGALLVSDSANGIMYQIEPDGRLAKLVDDPLIKPDAAACPEWGLPQLSVGANGLAINADGDLLIAVTNRGTIVRVPMRGRSTGTPGVWVGGCGPLVGADGLTMDRWGNLIVAVNRQNTIVRVRPDGTMDTLATADDGLEFPASPMFGKVAGAQDWLFIANFAVLARKNPGVLALRVAAPQTSDPDRPVALVGTLPGQLGASASGRFAYYRFSYPGDKSVYTINLKVRPDAVIGQAGFRVYGPQVGNVYARGGGQSSLPANVSANLVGIDRGEYLVQVYNYDPAAPVTFEVSLVRGLLEGQAR